MTTTPSPPPLADPPPVERLSRRTLIAAAGIMALTLTVVVWTAVRKPVSPAVVNYDPPATAPGSRPTFIDRRPAVAVPVAGSRQEEEALRRLAEFGALERPVEPPSPNSAPLGTGEPPGTAGSPGPVRPAGPTHQDVRREEFFRALRSPLVPNRPTQSSEERPPTSPYPLPQGLPFPFAALPATAPAASPAASLPTPSRSADRTADLLAAEPSSIPVRTLHPDGPAVPAGTAVEAILLTEVNSDLPGELVAQVSRDVYDRRLQAVLIPRGSRLFGRYDNQVALGQNRMLVAWTRVVLPDGTTLSVPGLATTDPGGAAGVPAEVDNHVGRIFGNAVLLSLLAAGAQLSQPQQGSSLLAVSSNRQLAAAAVGQELTSVATEILRRNLAIQPTLRIPRGTEFLVLLRSDLAFPRS